MSLKDLPSDARPREKLLARGAAALSDVELLALLLRTGIPGKGVMQMAQELLNLKKSSKDTNSHAGFDGISGLLNASAEDLKGVKGLGPAKRAEIMAVLELQDYQVRETVAVVDSLANMARSHEQGKRSLGV